MRAQPSRQARGHISIVQEHRFCLITDEGQGLLFTLSHDANLDSPQLQRFCAEHTTVLVEYHGAPDLSSGVAHSIRPVAEHRPPPAER